MEARIRELRAWVDDWHQGEWSVAHLPKAFGAHVEYETGGGRYLGCSYTDSGGSTTIVINGDIVGTPMFIPVLGHEVAHRLLNHHWVHPCVRCIDQSPGELRAWMVSALLAIPTTVIERVEACELFPMDVVRMYRVPYQFVALRYAMAHPVRDDPFYYQTTVGYAQKFVQWVADQMNAPPAPLAAAAVAPGHASGTKPRSNGWRNSGCATVTASPGTSKAKRRR